jgi:hypothetical protein
MKDNRKTSAKKIEAIASSTPLSRIDMAALGITGAGENIQILCEMHRWLSIVKQHGSNHAITPYPHVYFQRVALKELVAVEKLGLNAEERDKSVIEALCAKEHKYQQLLRRANTIVQRNVRMENLNLHHRRQTVAIAVHAAVEKRFRNASDARICEVYDVLGPLIKGRISKDLYSQSKPVDENRVTDCVLNLNWMMNLLHDNKGDEANYE